MTNREIIDLFKRPYGDKTGTEPSTFPWSDEAILDYLLNIRAFYIKDLIKKGTYISPQNFLTICFNLEEVDVNDCPCAPPSGCTWKKTIKKLPASLTPPRVYTLDGTDEFSFIEWNKVASKKDSRIPSIKSNTFFYTVKNEYLYLPLDPFLEALSATAVYTNNYEALINSCQVTESILCKPFDAEFGPDLDTNQAILERAWRVLPSVRGMAALDILNNDQVE